MTTLLALAALTAVPAPFGIHVVDDRTGRGVPLVELRTVSEQRWISDNAGWVAIVAPDLMGQKVFFHVTSHGYEFAKDGFGYHGKALDVTPGGRVELKLRRLNLAERLYRITGTGGWADSELLDQPVPAYAHTIHGGVWGQDTVCNTLYHGKLFWFWGDTNRASYPLGNFMTTGATSLPPAAGGLDPEVGIDLTYFGDGKGFTKQMVPVEGPGPVWVDGVVALPDGQGGAALVCSWAKVNEKMEAKRRGVGRWNDAKEQFETVLEFPGDAPVRPGGHPVIHEGYLYFPAPYGLTRTKADLDSLLHLERYESFTPLAADGSIGAWAWRVGAVPLTQKAEAELLKAGKLPPAQARLQLHDIDGGKPVQAHGGSCYWNAWRHKWILIAGQAFGASSYLGEIWYAEAPEITGPWGPARKIITHDKYSFYNPKQDPFFDRNAGQTIYLEGTYTTTFSRQGDATPRYDYNQMLYRLDLADASRGM